MKQRQSLLGISPCSATENCQSVSVNHMWPRPYPPPFHFAAPPPSIPFCSPSNWHILLNRAGFSHSAQGTGVLKRSITCPLLTSSTDRKCPVRCCASTPILYWLLTVPRWEKKKKTACEIRECLPVGWGIPDNLICSLSYQCMKDVNNCWSECHLLANYAMAKLKMQALILFKKCNRDKQEQKSLWLQTTKQNTCSFFCISIGTKTFVWIIWKDELSKL